MLNNVRVILLIFFIINVSITQANSDILPDRYRTPGVVLTTNANTICKVGYSKSVRYVSKYTKKLVYLSYGIIESNPQHYEIDHLISLQLGGSNSIKNLWPESYITPVFNAHLKNRLENRLHTLICKGTIPVTEAQIAISNDWIKAYNKYVGKPPK
jgi:hypothetical protein